mgnify:CR=1 FL=1
MDIQIDLVTFVISLIAVVCVCMYAMEVVHARRVEKLKNLCDERQRAIKREKKCVARLKQQCDVVKNAKEDGTVTLYSDGVPYLTMKEGDFKNE